MTSKNNANNINKYNQFLKTLDNNNKNTYYNDVNDVNNVNDDEKEVIKVLIKMIDDKFLNLNLNSEKFTGITENNLQKEVKKEKRIENEKGKEKEIVIIEPIVKNYINIDAEINNIGDILTLVDTYKLDRSIKYNINLRSLHNIKDPLIELNNMVGMKQLKSNVVDQIIYFAQDLHKGSNFDFMHTVIYGPPGTGKTEIAKIMGKIYSKMGILNKGTFKKVTRSDLVAGFLGQTAIKTRDVIKECIGGVLFIDEAYSLGNGSSENKDIFSKECIDTLCEALSEHKHEIMVIIAGYEKELQECFFKSNQGLDSRFTWRFKTDDYNADDLYNIFLKKVKDIGWSINTNGTENININWFKKNMAYFKFYGRDMETLLAKIKIAHGRRVFCKSDDEKKKINFADMENGLKMYLNNDNVKNRKNSENMKEIINSMYV
jgi:SpoVK/Ycf46/Vps4 family AAA+-type ATPase